MLPTMFGCSAQGSASPLALSITDPGPLFISVPPGSSGATSNSGDISSTATATGGAGGYTYSWTLSEFDDPENAFAVASQGTTNVATYNTGTVSTTHSNPVPPTPPPPPPATAQFRISCTVTDANSDTATAFRDFTVDVV